MFCSSPDRLQVRAHHSGGAADFGVMLDLVYGRAPFAAAFSQCFERHIHPDLVAEFESVRDRFGNVVDAHRGAFYPMFFDAFGQCGPGEIMNPQRRRFNARAMSAAPDCHPYFEGVLRRQVMKIQPESRQSAVPASRLR